MNLLHCVTSILGAALISACGGGGSSPGASTPPSTNPPPVIRPKCGGDLETSYVLSPVTNENDLFSSGVGDLDQFTYEDFLSPNREYSRQVIDDETLANSGSLTERYEARTGDCGGNDCGRSPPYYRTESAAYSAAGIRRGWRKWFGLSFKVDYFDLIETTVWDGTAITQIPNIYFSDDGSFGDARANLAFKINSEGSLVLENSTYSYDVTLNRSSRLEDRETYHLAEKDVVMNGWNHMIIDVTLDQLAPLRVWLNGQCVFEGDIDTLDSGWNSTYLKWGLYRESSLEENNDSAVYKQAIYFDDIREGDTYEDIAY